jgi:hypothetical protein
LGIRLLGWVGNAHPIEAEREPVHWCAGGDVDLAPGLTPLTGQYQRPDESWVCWDRGTLSFAYMTDRDKSDQFTKCVRTETAVDVARLTYYAGKIIQLLKGVPMPPP